VRRKSKPRVVWLPQTNANSIGAGNQVYQLAVISGLAGPTGTTSTAEIPLVLDSQQSIVASTDPSLADIENSGYRLRRIVGKVWCQLAQSTPGQDASAPNSVIVSAGIMVRRTDDTTGASFASANDANINVGFIENTGDPWVWRRSWTLGDRYTRDTELILTASLSNFFVENQFFPSCNWGKEYAGGIAEGPHVDQKTARIIGPEERLFLDVSATIPGETSNQPGTGATVAFWTDLRVLGSMRTSSGNRRNASR